MEFKASGYFHTFCIQKQENEKQPFAYVFVWFVHLDRWIFGTHLHFKASVNEYSDKKNEMKWNDGCIHRTTK